MQAGATRNRAGLEEQNGKNMIGKKKKKRTTELTADITQMNADEIGRKMLGRKMEGAKVAKRAD